MQISQALKITKEKLHEAKIESANLDALLLLCHVLKATKEQVVFNPQKTISKEEENLFFDLIARRLNKEPISQILGKKEFFGLDFFVDKNVLTPRSDSEILVELAINLIKENKSLKMIEGKPKTHILELGVGSGCLIISILKNLDFAYGMAVDISENALEIAKKNAVFHEIENRLELIKSDLFVELKPTQKFDFIISNPPYIRSEEIIKLDDEVKNFEPKLALDGGKSGLEFYERIAKQAKDFLKEKGKIILEIGFDQKQDVVRIFKDSGFELLVEKPDLARRDRVLCFTK